MQTFAERAGKKSIAAHKDFVAASDEKNEMTERAKNKIRERGNATLDDAVNDLRLHGIQQPDDEEAAAAAELGSLSSLLDEPPLDFRPLQRIYFADLLVKFFNRTALVGLLLAVGYLYGVADHESAARAAADAQQFESQLRKLEQGAAK